MKCCVVFLMTNDYEKGFQVPHSFFRIIKVNNLCLCFPSCILQIASSPGHLCPLFSSAHHLQVTSELNVVFNVTLFALKIQSGVHIKSAHGQRDGTHEVVDYCFRALSLVF